MNQYNSTEIMAMPCELDMQIRMLYCEYGWDIPKIAALLKISEAAVRLTVDSSKLTKPTDLAKIEPEKYEQGVAVLKATEVTKQQQLAPVQAVIEIALLQRIMEASALAKHPDDLSTLVNAFKKLTQDAVINTIVEEEKKNGKNAPQVAVQVINRFD